MIASFKGKFAEKVATGVAPKGFPADLLRSTHRLEALKGNRAGQHSIRINEQWRICLRWEDGAAHEVEIVDYH